MGGRGRASLFLAGTVFFFLWSATAGAQANVPVHGDFLLEGLKYPNDKLEGRRPTLSPAWAPADLSQLGGFNELVPFVIASPDQEDAGSCLYMSMTGIAEWWLARLYPQRPRDLNGPLDLSERQLMNLSGLSDAAREVKNWRTDTIFLYNSSSLGVLNRSFRFTKGWFRETLNGYERASPNSAGATYGTAYNWIYGLDTTQTLTVRLPKFARSVIFADANSNQWAVGVAPADIVGQVKALLRVRKAPVQVIYNHYGYWHSVFIVGFDDAKDTEGCPFVNGSDDKFAAHVEDLRRSIAESTDPSEKTLLNAQLSRSEEALDQLRRHPRDRRCNPHGVFYVRDSLYSSPNSPIYDYDTSQSGEERPYATPIVYREYAWLELFGNHVTQIYLLSP